MKSNLEKLKDEGVVCIFHESKTCYVDDYPEDLKATAPAVGNTPEFRSWIARSIAATADTLKLFPWYPTTPAKTPEQLAEERTKKAWDEMSEGDKEKALQVDRSKPLFATSWTKPQF